MPDPVTVWLVRPGETRGVPGLLSLSPAGLTFQAPGGTALRIDREAIRGARRAPWTPVVTVRYVEGGRTRVAHLYFHEPPPLHLRRPGRRRRRMEAVTGLSLAPRELKELAGEWARAIREARA